MAMSNWNDSLGGYDPFFDIRHIHNQVDDIFHGFFNERQVGRGQSQQGQRGSWLPVVDVRESDKGITIHAELPGIKKEDIHLDMSEGVLTLSGEKKDMKKEDDEHYHRVERSYGKFTRSFALPKGVDPTQITASFTDGVLELSIPKPATQAPQKKKIEVK